MTDLITRSNSDDALYVPRDGAAANSGAELSGELPGMEARVPRACLRHHLPRAFCAGSRASEL